MLKLLVLLLCVSVYGYRPYCDKKTVFQRMQMPTYDFSIQILDRVAQETDGHFIFSPISTWLQMLVLADGAKGKTLNEILKVTRFYRTICSRILIKEIFNALHEELHMTMKHRSIIVIDNLMNVKQSFKRNVEKLSTAIILSENFRNVSETATKVNDIIKMDTNETITESLDSDDFNRKILLMVDAACMKANWRSPFNPVYTKPEIFYSNEKVPIGHVNMMHQTGYFSVTYVPAIDTQILELPFNDRLTMFLLLPKNGTAADLFWSMNKVSLPTIFKLLKSGEPRLVNVKLPRFKLTTDIDNIPELLYDMGIQRIFIPRIADLRKISDHKIFVSMMVNQANIEVTETGVSGNVGPDSLIARRESMDMTFNQPFTYLIVDKATTVILFAVSSYTISQL